MHWTIGSSWIKAEKGPEKVDLSQTERHMKEYGNNIGHFTYSVRQEHWKPGKTQDYSSSEPGGDLPLCDDSKFPKVTTNPVYISYFRYTMPCGLPSV